MTMSAELTALRDEAMAVSCIGWAIQKRWVLSRVGIDRSGPCPKCGGTDRFSIHTKDDLFNCRSCGLRGHGVIDLVMHTEGVEFVAACEIITGRKASEPVSGQRMAELRRQAEDKARRDAAAGVAYRERARTDGHAIWEAGAPLGAGRAVLDYLTLRAIDLSAFPLTAFGALRLHPGLPWTEEFTDPERGSKGYRTLEIGPAMLARVVLPKRLLAAGDPLGAFGAVHMTWLDPLVCALSDQPPGERLLGQPLLGKGKLVLPIDEAGKPRPSKKVRGSKRGGAIPLFTPSADPVPPRRIVMGEGIETTLTALCHAYEPETAYWAGIDVGNMAGKSLRVDGTPVHDQPDLDDQDCFLPPDWCEELVYLGEGDDASVHSREKCLRGLRRAKLLRERAIAAGAALPPLRTTYVPPLEAGKDMNDLAMEDQDEEDEPGNTAPHPAADAATLSPHAGRGEEGGEAAAQR